MATLDDRVDKLEDRYSNLHTVVNVLATKVDALSDKIDLFVGEMREQNKLRAEEIRGRDAKLDNISNQTRNITLAAIVGIGAVALSSFGMAVGVLYSLFK